MADFYSGNRYLTLAEMQHNAELVMTFLKAQRWSVNAICGVLGNMQSESGINPGIWQSLDEGNMEGGYGLVQWTPATKFTDWADANGYEWDDGYAQLYWLHTEPRNGQWLPTEAYPLSFEEFVTSSESVEYLASAFLKNFERPGIEVEEQRRAQAREWFSYFNGTDPDPDPDIPPVPSKKKKSKFKFVLFKRRWI